MLAKSQDVTSVLHRPAGCSTTLAPIPTPRRTSVLTAGGSFVTRVFSRHISWCMLAFGGSTVTSVALHSSCWHICGDTSGSTALSSHLPAPSVQSGSSSAGACGGTSGQCTWEKSHLFARCVTRHLPRSGTCERTSAPIQEKDPSSAACVTSASPSPARWRLICGCTGSEAMPQPSHRQTCPERGKSQCGTSDTGVFTGWKAMLRTKILYHTCVCKGLAAVLQLSHRQSLHGISTLCRPVHSTHALTLRAFEVVFLLSHQPSRRAIVTSAQSGHMFICRALEVLLLPSR